MIHVVCLKTASCSLHCISSFYEQVAIHQYVKLNTAVLCAGSFLASI